MAKKYWVAGHAATGKSTVCEELCRLGYNALDGDRVPQLASWQDLKTGQKVTIRHNGYVDHSKIDWAWDDKVLKELLTQPGEIFLCGSAVNDIDYFELFDKVFVLAIDPKTQKRRLTERTNNSYGRDPRMHASILEETNSFTQKLTDMGATAVDATLPLNEVVEQILEVANEN